MDELEGQVKQTTAECEKLKKELSTSEHQRQALEKKHQNAQHKLNKVTADWRLSLHYFSVLFHHDTGAFDERK